MNRVKGVDSGAFGVHGLCKKWKKYFCYRPAEWSITQPMGGTCISRRFRIGYVNSRRMCVVGLAWQPTTPTGRRELSHTSVLHRPIPEGAFVILYENAPCVSPPVSCVWSSFFVPAGRSRLVSLAATWVSRYECATHTI